LAHFAMAQGTSLLAACGGETVKLFDVSIETGDPCTFQYTPSPGYQVNCARWNHTSTFLRPLPLGVLTTLSSRVDPAIRFSIQTGSSGF
jgi:hypothetical protein